MLLIACFFLALNSSILCTSFLVGRIFSRIVPKLVNVEIGVERGSIVFWHGCAGVESGSVAGVERGSVSGVKIGVERDSIVLITQSVSSLSG